MILDIIKWNYERNGLVYSEELENRLLQEELTEFKEALTRYLELTKEEAKDVEAVDTAIVDMLDAVGDTFFVLMGSNAKSLGSSVSFDNYRQQMGFAFDVVREVLLQQYKIEPEVSNMLFDKVISTIVEANKAKGNKKDENGKVIKPEGFAGPEVKIRELIKDAMKIQEQLNEQRQQKSQMGPININPEDLQKMMQGQ